MGIKKGTKLTDHPKNQILRIRMDEDTANKLKAVCEKKTEKHVRCCAGWNRTAIRRNKKIDVSRPLQVNSLHLFKTTGKSYLKSIIHQMGLLVNDKKEESECIPWTICAPTSWNGLGKSVGAGFPRPPDYPKHFLFSTGRETRPLHFFKKTLTFARTSSMIYVRANVR